MCTEDIKLLSRLPVFGTLRADLGDSRGVAMVNELTMHNHGDIGLSIDLIEGWMSDLEVIKLSILSKEFFGGPIDLGMINEDEIKSFTVEMKAQYAVDVGDDFRDYLYSIKGAHAKDIERAATLKHLN